MKASWKVEERSPPIEELTLCPLLKQLIPAGWMQLNADAASRPNIYSIHCWNFFFFFLGHILFFIQNSQELLI